MGSSMQTDLAHIIKFCYENASRLNHYNHPAVNAIDFPVSIKLFVHFSLIRYRDMAVQAKYIFQAQLAPLYGHEYSSFIDNQPYQLESVSH